MAIPREIVASEWIDRAWPLLEEHYAELATVPDIMLLKPDVERYQTLEAAGNLFAIGMFDTHVDTYVDADGNGAETLVGYSVNIVCTNLHYGDLLMCQNDLLFVRKSHRRGMTGMRLITATERAAKERGVKMMLWHAKPGTTLDRMLPRLGYGIQDVIYSQVL
jgi:GNAT superfamily N-acetyltransferase